MQLHILIVDDHPIVLEGCRSLLSEHYQPIYSAATIAEAKELIEHKKVELLLSDHHLSDGLGIELVMWVKRHHPGIKILVLSMEDDSSTIQKYLDLQVDGYVLKNDIHANLHQAVSRVMSGKHFMSDEVTEIVLAGKKPRKKQEISLSPREQEVLKLITEEKSTKDIAERLFISERTVETHRKNILRKTGCSSLVGLVKYAIQVGILES